MQDQQIFIQEEGQGSPLRSRLSRALKLPEFTQHQRRLLSKRGCSQIEKQVKQEANKRQSKTRRDNPVSVWNSPGLHVLQEYFSMKGPQRPAALNIPAWEMEDQTSPTVIRVGVETSTNMRTPKLPRSIIQFVQPNIPKVVRTPVAKGVQQEAAPAPATKPALPSLPKRKISRATKLRTAARPSLEIELDVDPPIGQATTGKPQIQQASFLGVAPTIYEQPSRPNSTAAVEKGRRDAPADQRSLSVVPRARMAMRTNSINIDQKFKLTTSGSITKQPRALKPLPSPIFQRGAKNFSECLESQAPSQIPQQPKLEDSCPSLDPVCYKIQTLKKRFDELNHLSSPTKRDILNTQISALLPEEALESPSTSTNARVLRNLQAAFSTMSPQAKTVKAGRQTGMQVFSLQKPLTFKSKGLSTISGTTKPSSRCDFKSTVAEDLWSKPLVEQQKKQARNLMVTLNREVDKLERAQSKQKKRRMATQFTQDFGIQIPEKRVFFTKSEQLEAEIINQGQMLKMDRAARRIQKWFRFKKSKVSLVLKLRSIVLAVVSLQKMNKTWVFKKKLADRIELRREKASSLVQKFLRGYLERRALLPALSQHRAEVLHEHYRKIDLVMRNHFQRMIRRAWLAHKQRKLDRERFLKNLKRRGTVFQGGPPKRVEKKSPQVHPRQSSKGLPSEEIAALVTRINAMEVENSTIFENGVDKESSSSEDPQFDLTVSKQTSWNMIPAKKMSFKKANTKLI